MLWLMEKRVLLLVMDGVGIGEMPDAKEYGDEGSNTLKNLSRAVSGLNLPCLESLGLGNLGDFKGISKNKNPKASYGIMLELSKGKDTVTGHWEMMGIVNKKPFPTYPDGFPPEIIREFENTIGKKILGNRAASGTEIIKELGEEHIKTGIPIVYTSADSVFQIAAHEEVISLEELYRMCEIARKILVEPHNVCRVIARPFTGTPGNFSRTPRRRDFTIPPQGDTVLDHLVRKGIKVISVGKVIEMFAGRGFSEGIKMKNNEDGMETVVKLLGSLNEGLIFCTLTDFDTVYGHRNDPEGFARALEDFDGQLTSLIREMRDDDYLILTADHGCDPTTPSTDHSREYVPVLFYNKTHDYKALGTRSCFCDVGATIADLFGLRGLAKGKSFFDS